RERLVAKRLAGRVEHDRDGCTVARSHELVEHRREAIDGTGRQASPRGERWECVESAEQVTTAVDEVEPAGTGFTRHRLGRLATWAHPVHAAGRRTALTRFSSDHRYAPEFLATNVVSRENVARMIEVQDLTKRYGDRVVLKGISFSAAQGQI